MPDGRVLLAGSAEGWALVLEEPLSFWGGFDPLTGTIVDRRHPQAGGEAAGRVLLLPAGRGSSSSSSVLAEAVRAGTAPAALILLEPDEIVVLGLLVAEELYGRTVPVVVLRAEDYRMIGNDDYVHIGRDGQVSVEANPKPVGRAG